MRHYKNCIYPHNLLYSLLSGDRCKLPVEEKGGNFSAAHAVRAGPHSVLLVLVDAQKPPRKAFCSPGFVLHVRDAIKVCETAGCEIAVPQERFTGSMLPLRSCDIFHSCKEIKTLKFGPSGREVCDAAVSCFLFRGVAHWPEEVGELLFSTARRSRCRSPVSADLVVRPH